MKSETPEQSIDDRYRDLCAAAGHLFISFSRLEGTLSAKLRLHLSNNLGNHLDDHKGVVLASAIYGSMRFKTARDTLRRITKTENASDQLNEFLDDLFAQLAHIENLRDKLAHQVVVAVHPDHATKDGYWQVSDQTVTRDLKNIKIYVFDTAAVLAAVQDIQTASNRIGNVKETKTLFERISLEPVSWLYKPSMLKQVPRGTTRTRLG